MMSGSSGAWKRAHRTPRRALFTPHRVAGGPGREVALSTRRTTSGAFVGTGEKFVIIDDYDDGDISDKPALSHTLNRRRRNGCRWDMLG